MSADEVLTWDRALVDGGASRPTLALLDAGELLDDEAHPPVTDGTEPYAAQLNQWSKQIVAVGRVASSAIMTIDCSSGSVVKVALQTPSEILALTDFTITIDSTGVSTVSWTSGALPPMTCDPTLTLNSDGDYTGVALVASPTSITVKTRSGGTLANARWTLQIN